MLALENISSGYGSTEIVHDISITVDRGEMVSLIGANGAGKSTLLRTISGLLRAKAGRILFEGKEISRLQPEKITEMGIIQIPEGRHIFAPLTVYENLLLGTYAKRKKLSKAGKRQLFDFVFQLFPILAERQKQLAGTLSGGEQQMLATGRALMAQPKLLLCDEPSIGLAPIVVGEIVRVLRELNKQGVSILLVEQNAMMALSTVSRGYVMDLGHIIIQGEAAQLLQDSKVKEIYLGA